MRINGNLVFNTNATSEIQNAYVERLAASPTFNSSEKGRLYFNTTTALYYYNDGAAWVPFATGGNASALQAEVDALEVSLGNVVNSNGTYNGPTALAGVPIISGATSVTDALTLLANASDVSDTLAALSDVALGTLADGQYLRYNTGTSKWVNDTLTVAKITDLTASAAELNILDGATLTVTELNYVDGVASPIQDQLDNKQALDAGLTALAAFNQNGILVQTADNVWAARSLVAPTEGFTISNANGVAGNPTFALANDLGSLEALATTGYGVRTGTDTWATRSIAGQAGQIVVTDGDGVASNTDIALATVTDGGTGTFLKFTRDAYGRVSGTTAVVATDVTALVSSIYVDVAGDTMTGNLNMGGTNTVTGLATPSADSDAANKAYVDAVAAGLTWKNAVTVIALADTSVSSAPAAIDGYTLTSGDRVLLTGQSTSAENGIYVYNGSGSAMTRTTDADAFGELNGAAVFVEEGTVYADSGWTQTTTLSGFGGQVWSQFSGSAAYTWGTGLQATGNTVNINLGAGIAELPSDEVGIDLYSATGALILTSDGSTSSTAAGAQLFLKLGASGGLTQDAGGLYVPANGITNAMILNETHGLNADASTGTLALGETLAVIGSSAQGIITSVTGQTFTVSADDATTASKGVASFSAYSFVVTAGDVAIKTAGVTNAQLANSTVTLTGTTGSDAFALGESVAIVGGASGEVSTAVAANQVAITVRDATASLKGVASFDAADFLVTAGAVTAVAKNLDSLTDVVVTTAGAGDTLVNNGTSFVNRKTYFLYESSGSSTSHVVAHNLGQKYCNVTVVDSTDEVVIPQSITFNSATGLTVTFSSAINCKVVVMGVNSAA